VSLRILHITPSYLPAVRYGGPIWSVHGLAKAQSALGHYVEVYTTNIDGAGESDVPVGQAVNLKGVDVTYFGSSKLRRLFYAPELDRALKKNITSFDIVHTHSVFLWPTMAGARTARKAGIPYVLSPRGMLWREVIEERSKWIKKAWILAFEKTNVESASAIHVTAQLEADKMKDLGFNLPHIINLPNAVDRPKIFQNSGISSDVSQAIKAGDYLLSLGRLSWKKNNLSLIKAMSAVPSLRAIIAGNEEDGHATKLRDLIEKRGLSERVTLLSRQISGADKAALFEQCKFFVLPSFSENFGNTVLEAMIYAKPVIVSESAGAVELVKRHGCGLSCQPEENSIATAIKIMMAAPDQLIGMGEKGRVAVLENYGWTHIAQAMCSAYTELRL